MDEGVGYFEMEAYRSWTWEKNSLHVSTRAAAFGYLDRSMPSFPS